MTAVLELHGVSKKFYGVQALDNVEFSVKTGEILGMIGPNGAGKTTLINIITGLDRTYDGTVLALGLDITRQPAHKIARIGLSRTFQNVRLFPDMSVVENVMAGSYLQTGTFLRLALPTTARKIKEDAMHWLDFFGIAHLANRKIAELSYGDLRRTEMARALIMRPKILLLDEPAAGMNDVETDELAEDILRIRSHLKAILVVEHHISFMTKVCDRLLALNFGKVVTIGTPDEVLHHPDVVHSYLGA